MKKCLKCLYLVPVLSVLLLSGCATFEGGTSNLPSPKPLAQYKPQYKVQKLWASRVGSSSGDFKLAPSYGRGVIYTTGADGRVSATKAKSGQELWSTKTRTNISTGPGIGSGMLAVGTADGYVIGLNAKTGATLWEHRVSDQILAAPAIGQNVVVVKTIDGNVFALNAKDGKQLWAYQHGAPALILRGSSVPEISGDKVAVGFADGKLAILALHSGKLLWERTIASPQGSTAVQQLVDIDAAPKLQDGSIYVATYQGNIDSIDLSSGQLFWRHKISSYAGLTAGPERVFVADANSNLWAFDSLSGGVDWRQNKLAYRNITGPVVMGNTVVVGDLEGYLHFLNKADGKLVARTYVDQYGMNAAPLVVGKTIYAYSRDGVLSAYRLVA